MRAFFRAPGSYSEFMRLTPNQMAAAMFALVAGGILVALALGSDMSDLPWGAIILALILGVFFMVVQRRRRREIAAMSDDSDGVDQP